MPNLTGADLKKLAKEQRQQGLFDGALDSLQQAIDLAGAELADLHGILGGTLADQGDLVAAAKAYDDGFKVDSRYNPLSSYNALNRLVMRIRLIPGVLTQPELMRKEARLDFVDVPYELALLQTKLERHVEHERANDFWAAGDLALTAALNGSIEVTSKAAERFSKCAPPEFAITAYRRTLAALGELDIPCKQPIKSLDILLAANADSEK
jgi:tetratricopeptide (TPR) repeat protein